ncbi:helix-turn-helix transcriptional regulator [Brachybacterium sp. DNPG3]
MSEVTKRALRLLAMLQSRTVWTGPELARELDVTTRTVRRDIDRLREMGYPVLTSAGHGGGYQLGAGRELPPLLLGEQEAVAVAVGLRLATRSGIEGLDEEALRALAALDRILPPTVRAEVSALSDAVSVISRRAPSARPEVLMALAAAVRDRVRVRVDYEKGDGQRGERRLEPYRMLAIESHWYLFAWDLDREDWRTFRLDRMHEVAVSTFSFTPRPTPDVEATVRRSVTVAPYEHEAVVRIRRPAEEIAPLLPARTAEVMPDDGRAGGAGGGVGGGRAGDGGAGDGRAGDGGADPGACILRMGGDLGWVAMRLALLGEPIEVISPPELARTLEELSTWAGRAAATWTAED